MEHNHLHRRDQPVRREFKPNTRSTKPDPEVFHVHIKPLLHSKLSSEKSSNLFIFRFQEVFFSIYSATGIIRTLTPITHGERETLPGKDPDQKPEWPQIALWRTPAAASLASSSGATAPALLSFVNTPLFVSFSSLEQLQGSFSHKVYSFLPVVKPAISPPLPCSLQNPDQPTTS